MGRHLSRRSFLGAVGAAAVGTAAGWTSSLRFGSVPRPENVVFIVLDAFRADRLSMLREGQSITPNLGALARSSLVFDNCYSPSSWTKTSMASILVGANPPYHGVMTSLETIPRGCDTIQTLLNRNGRSTHAVQTNPWLIPEGPNIETHGKPVRMHGFHRGFERYMYLDPLRPAARDGRAPVCASAAEVNEAVRYILPRAPKPLFLYAHYMDTHQPWMGIEPREFTGLYASEGRGSSPEEIFERDNALVEKVLTAPPDEVTEDDVRHMCELYDESVRYMDRMAGELLDVLHEGLDLDKTLLIITADHGDELWEHKRFDHANTLYEEVARVPLVIRHPCVSRGRASARVSNVGLYETIKALVCPEDSGREPMCAPLVDSHGRPPAADALIFAQLRSAMASRDWKLTKVLRGDGQEAIIRSDSAGNMLEAERYNLVDDPGETNPLPQADLEAFTRIAGRIERDEKSLAALHEVEQWNTESKWQMTFGSPEEEPGLSEEDRQRLEQLRTLGYFR